MDPASNTDSWPVVSKNAEKRCQPRYPSLVKFWLITYDTDSVIPKFIKFKTANISNGGALVQTMNYPFTYKQKVDIALILTLNEQVTKIHRLSAIARHQVPNGFTGFSFTKRI